MLQVSIATSSSSCKIDLMDSGPLGGNDNCFDDVANTLELATDIVLHMFHSVRASLITVLSYGSVTLLAGCLPQAPIDVTVRRGIFCTRQGVSLREYLPDQTIHATELALMYRLLILVFIINYFAKFTFTGTQ